MAKDTSGYYVCEASGIAIAGPYVRAKQAVDFIWQQYPENEHSNYFTSSRYMLAKEGLYPRTKAGDKKLMETLNEKLAKR